MQGSALVSDDHSRWAVSGTGFQPVPEDEPIDMETTFVVMKDEWKPTIRAAIDAAITAGRKET